MQIIPLGDCPDSMLKSEERPFRLPPIRDGSSQIPGNSSMISNDLQNGDGNLAWEVDVSDWFPHGQTGKKPGLFYFASFVFNFKGILLAGWAVFLELVHSTE